MSHLCLTYAEGIALQDAGLARMNSSGVFCCTTCGSAFGRRTWLRDDEKTEAIVERERELNTGSKIVPTAIQIYYEELWGRLGTWTEDAADAEEVC